MIRQAGLLLCAALAWSGLARAGGGRESVLTAYRPKQVLWEPGKTPPVDWKPTWQATYAANKARFSASPVPAPRRWAATPAGGPDEVYLLESLIERFPDEKEKRIAAYRRIAAVYSSAGQAAKANHYSRKLIEESPGRVDVAAEALGAILGRTNLHWQWYNTSLLAEWADYAADRVEALHRMGHLSADSPLVATALRSRVHVASLLRCRFLEAAEAVEAARHLPGGAQLAADLTGSLLVNAGHTREAIGHYERLGAVSQAEGLGESLAPRPEVSRDFSAEMRWQALGKMPLAEQVREAGAVYAMDAAGNSLLPWGDDRHASIWVLADRYFRSQRPAALAPLRRARDAEIRAAIDRARRAGDAGGILKLYRMHPWSEAVHEALMGLGETHLRRGHAGIALRCFQDVLSHTIRPGLRAEAQAGVRLASAQLDRSPAPQRAASASLRRLTPPPIFPWDVWSFRVMSGPIRAAAAQRLWEVRSAGDKVVIAGPNAVACYGADLSRPLWVRRCEPPGASHAKRRGGRGVTSYTTATGPFDFCISGGRVLTRWNMRPTIRLPRTVAALDLATGEMLWSAEDDPAWSTTLPVTGPTAADGRVYFLAVHREELFARLYLICLDEATGKMLWRRHLGSSRVAAPVKARPFSISGLELAYYGNPVTVRAGAVYCSTAIGLAARCDARDGTVEWVRTYPQTQMRYAYAARRHGARPVVSAGRVIFAPRDFLGAFALDADSGRLIWQNLHVPAHEFIGETPTHLLLQDDRTIVSLETASGRVSWRRRFDEGLAGRAALAGGEVVAATPQRLVQLDVETGRALAERPWGQGPPVGDLVVRGRELIGMALGAVRATRSAKPLNPAAVEKPPPLQLPLEPVWALHRPDPEFVDPPNGPDLPGRFLLISNGVLECLRAGPRGGIEWQLAMPPDLIRTLWAGRTLLLVCGREVQAVDPAAGSFLWRTEIPFLANKAAATERHLLVTGAIPRTNFFQAAGIDVATGKLLWSKDVNEFGSSRMFHARPDGEDFRLFVAVGDMCRQVTCRGRDGSFGGVRSIAMGASAGRFLGTAGGKAFLLGGNGRIITVDTTAKYPRANLHRGRCVYHHYHSQQRLVGRWLGFWSTGGAMNVYDAADPSFLLTRRRGEHGPWYDIGEDRFYELNGRGRRGRSTWGGPLTVTELTTKKLVGRYEIAADGVHLYRIPECWEEADRLYALCYLRRKWRKWRREGAARLDVFDRATGKRLASQVLASGFHWYARRNDPPYQPRLIRSGGLLILTDARGVYAFAPAGPGRQAPPAAVAVPYRRPGSVRADGSDSDWDGRGTVELNAAGTRLHLAHDGQALHIGVACADGSFRPRRGRGPTAAGDMVQLVIEAGGRTHAWSVGANARGRIVPEPLGSAGVPKGTRCAIRADLGRGRRVCELAVPLEEIGLGGASRTVRLSVLICDDRTGPQRSRHVITWGKLLPGLGVRAVGRKTLRLEAAPGAKE